MIKTKDATGAVECVLDEWLRLLVLCQPDQRVDENGGRGQGGRMIRAESLLAPRPGVFSQSSRLVEVRAPQVCEGQGHGGEQGRRMFAAEN